MYDRKTRKGQTRYLIGYMYMYRTGEGMDLMRDA